MPDSKKRRVHWPMDLLVGDLVSYKGQRMRVISAHTKDVPDGCVPIVSEERYDPNSDKFKCVPADDLN